METKTSPVKGIKLIRTANIISVISTCLTIVSAIAMIGGAGVGLGMAMENPGSGLSPAAAIAAITGVGGVFIGLILFVTSGIMEIVGLAKSSKAHAGYKNALIVIVASFAVSVLISILPLPEFFKSIISVINPAIRALVVYFIINATSALLSANGNSELSLRGIKVRNIYIICAAICLVAELLVFVPALVTALNIATAITSVIQLVALFMYIKFLGQSAKALN